MHYSCVGVGVFFGCYERKKRKSEAGEQVETGTKERIRVRVSTCMLLNQTVAQRSHRVRPAHTGVIAVFDDLET